MRSLISARSCTHQRPRFLSAEEVYRTFLIDPDLTPTLFPPRKLLIMVRPERFELPTLWFEA
jgi:hypothetical protein